MMTTMIGCDLFEVEINRQLMKGRSDEDRRTLHMVQAGGLWTAHNLYKAGYLQLDVCPWCQGAQETLEHLWWECPAFEHLRADIRRYIPLGQHRHLPPCVALHGLPTELSGDLHGDVWRAQDIPWAGDDPDVTPQDTCTRQGQPTMTTDQALAWQQALPLLHRAGCEANNLTLRHLGEWMQEGYEPLPHWHLQAEEERAPAAINTYSDGSLWFGSCVWTGMGAWGVHKPGNDAQPLPPALAGKAWQEATPDGTTWSGQVLGPALSSTRMEAFGLLAALSAPGPTHVGIDNAAVVKRLGRLLTQGGRRRHHRRRPWGLQKDGDVWEFIDRFLQQKAPARWKSRK